MPGTDLQQTERSFSEANPCIYYRGNPAPYPQVFNCGISFSEYINIVFTFAFACVSGRKIFSY